MMLANLLILVNFFCVMFRTTQCILLDSLSKEGNYNHTDTSLNSRQKEELHNKPSISSLGNIDHPSTRRVKKISSCQQSKHFWSEDALQEHDHEMPGILQEDLDYYAEEFREAYNKTEPEDYPYAVFVISMGGNDKRVDYCSGSILTTEWVLTAAECVENAHYFWVYAGGKDGRDAFNYLDYNKPLPEGTQMIRSKSFMRHPDYTKRQNFNIGLITLKDKFKLTAQVNTVKIATIDFSNSYGDKYKTCVTTVFGLLSYRRENPDDMVRKTFSIDVKKPCNCLQTLMDITGSNGPRNYLCQRPIIGYGLCDGDTGGGLVCDGRIFGVNMMPIFFVDLENCIRVKASLILEVPDYDCGHKNEYYVIQEVAPSIMWVENTIIGRKREAEEEDTSSISSKSSHNYWIFIYLAVITIERVNNN